MNTMANRLFTAKILYENYFRLNTQRRADIYVYLISVINVKYLLNDELYYYSENA